MHLDVDREKRKKSKEKKQRKKAKKKSKEKKEEREPRRQTENFAGSDKKKQKMTVKYFI